MICEVSQIGPFIEMYQVSWLAQADKPVKVDAH